MSTANPPPFQVEAIARNTILVCQTQRDGSGDPAPLIEAHAGRLLSLAECDAMIKMLERAMREASSLPEMPGVRSTT